MGDRTAFFYGTLMAPEILHRCIYGSSTIPPHHAFAASQLTITPAMLSGYSRRKVRWADYPGITKLDGHSVRGTYVTGLTDGDIRRLDEFEGSEYSRKKVTVNVPKKSEEKEEAGGGVGGEWELVEDAGEEIEAETYVYTAGEGRLEAGEWDYEEFRREKMHRWADVSEEYADVDNLASTDVDPTGGRGIFSSDTKADEILRSAV